MHECIYSRFHKSEFHSVRADMTDANIPKDEEDALLAVKVSGLDGVVSSCAAQHGQRRSR